MKRKLKYILPAVILVLLLAVGSIALAQRNSPFRTIRVWDIDEIVINADYGAFTLKDYSYKKSGQLNAADTLRLMGILKTFHPESVETEYEGYTPRYLFQIHLADGKILPDSKYQYTEDIFVYVMDDGGILVSGRYSNLYRGDPEAGQALLRFYEDIGLMYCGGDRK